MSLAEELRFLVFRSGNVRFSYPSDATDLLARTRLSLTALKINANVRLQER